MAKVRVMHYLNQFFAGMGGEEKADTPVGYREGPIGPGKRLQALFGNSAEIVVTAYCGDDYFAESANEALAAFKQIADAHDVQMIVSGPAFGSGRYGFACVEVCHYLSNESAFYCVGAMHPLNPGVSGYKLYKDNKVFLFPTAEAVSSMEEALSKIAGFVLKLSAGSAIESAAREGYIPRGIRLETKVSKSGAERGIDMLLDKIAGRPFTTEIPIENFDKIPIPARIANLAAAHLAIVSTSGVVPLGNPDEFKRYHNTKWKKYFIGALNSMKDSAWEGMAGGHNTLFERANPNLTVPLDVCREMEKKGVFARLYPYFYTTVGNSAWILAMQAIGKEIASAMKADGVSGVLLVST